MRLALMKQELLGQLSVQYRGDFRALPELG